MDICEYCFKSEPILNHIKTSGKKLSSYKKCKHCHHSSQYRLCSSDFREKIHYIIRMLYEHEHSHGLVASAEMYGRREGDDVSLYLPNLMSLKDICAELFDIDYDNNEFYTLLRDNETDGVSEFDDDPEDECWLNMGCYWEGSDNIGLEWKGFCHNVKYTARFFDHSRYSRSDELRKLQKTFNSLSRMTSISLYRARLVDSAKTLEEIQKDPEAELGIAPHNRAGHNRFSPYGIPYIYLSENISTCLQEIRVKEHDDVAIGKFSINSLKLVDLRDKTLNEIIKNPFSESYTPEFSCSFKYIKEFIRDITQEVKDEDKKIDYIPTQLVSEYIWSLGYDGIIYDSSLGEGDNYLLFQKSYMYLSYKINTI